MSAGRTAVELVDANERFMTALEGQASAEVLRMWTDVEPRLLQLRYLFLAQTVASTISAARRADMGREFLTMLRELGQT